MNNSEINSTTNTVATLSKKGQAVTSYILELESEIENLKRQLSEEKGENKKLRADNAELEKVANSKQLQKEYIKEVEKQLDRLPPTARKNEYKKAELVKLFVDWTISIFNLIDKLPFKQSARFCYTERNHLISKILERQLTVVEGDVEQVGDYIKSQYHSGVPVKGISFGKSTVKTLDDFVNTY